MKEEYTKSSSKCLDIAKNFLTLSKLSFTFNKVGETRHLCTRTDSDVLEVESGSSTLMMTERCLSEFTSCYGVDSSFIFSSSSGFARPYFQEGEYIRQGYCRIYSPSGNVDDSPHRPFTPPHPLCVNMKKQHILNKLYNHEKEPCFIIPDVFCRNGLRAE